LDFDGADAVKFVGAAGIANVVAATAADMADRSPPVSVAWTA
jgi:hypothetical protein